MRFWPATGRCATFILLRVFCSISASFIHQCLHFIGTNQEYFCSPESFSAMFHVAVENLSRWGHNWSKVLYVLSNIFGFLGAPVKGPTLTSWRMVFSSNCGVLRRLSCLRPFFSGRRKNLHQLCSHCICLMRADIVEVIRDWFTSVTLLLKCSLYLEPLGFLFLITIFCHL